MLRAKNDATYSGKSKAFREQHKRDFDFTCKDVKDVILIDDIVTTGTTLKEAEEVLKKHSIRVHFALVLADAKEN